MNILLGVLIPLAYMASALAAARWLYGRLRARSIDYHVREYPHTYAPSRAVQEWNNGNRPEIVAAACALALFWPLTLIAVVAGRPVAAFVAGSPPRSQFEITQEHKQRDRRIAELERENERLRRYEP